MPRKRNLTGLKVIEEMAQCEGLNAKGKSFCKYGSVLQELSAEKTETLEDTTRQEMIHSSGLQWRKKITRSCRSSKSRKPRISNREASSRRLP